MLTLFVYHNIDARFASYQDGHRLIAVTSHRFAADGDRQPQDIAEWAFRTFNADLDQLEANRNTAAGETAFLAACVYRLLGYRSLSVGDVIHITDGKTESWLACEPSGWRPIGRPSNIDESQLMAPKVYERVRSQQTGLEAAPGSVTTAQVADVINRVADEILDAVDAGDEGLRDALNLMVNATSSYLAGEADTLREVVEVNYDENLKTVLGWIKTGMFQR